MAVLTSLDAILTSAQAKGLYSRAVVQKTPSTTAASANSGTGTISAQRMPNALSLPSSFGVGVTGVYFPFVRLYTAIVSMLVAALEFDLGTCTFATNTGTFTGGGSMPTNRVIRGTTIAQTATVLPMLAVSTVLAGATAKVVTVTYTNQAGTGGQTAAITLPDNPAVNSAFNLTPFLASGDTGIQSVTGIAAGANITSGVLKVYGLLPIQTAMCQTNAMVTLDPLAVPSEPWVAAASDKVGFYTFGTTSACDFWALLSGVADY